MLFILLCIAPLLHSVSSDTAEVAHKLLGNNTVKANITTASGRELYETWMKQAFSALMSAVANEKIYHMPARIAKKHKKCAQSAKTVESHAKCVRQLLDHHERLHSGRRVVGANPHREESEWQGSFRVARMKREVVSRSSYALMAESDRSPFGVVAKQITNSLRALKNKKEKRSWRSIIMSVKQKGKDIEKTKKVQRMIRNQFTAPRFRVREREQRPHKNHRLPLKNRRPLAQDFTSSSEESKEFQPMPNASQIAETFIKNPEKILQKDIKMTAEQKQSMAPVQLIRDGVKLGMSLAGRNVSEFDSKNINLVSPRFFSLVPEHENHDNDTIDVFSPSLFSLHSEGRGLEKETSLSGALGLFDKNDQDTWMDLITEAAGIADAVDDAEKQIIEKSEGMLVNSEGKEVQLSRKNVTDLYGEDGYRSMKVIEKLHGMYTEEQLNEFKSSGYALMTPAQRELLYGKGAPFEDEAALRAADNVTHKSLKRSLHKTIRHFADGKASFDLRMKDIVLSPIVGGSIILDAVTPSQALILSPVVLTPLVLSPAVFGSVILSPWLFVPVILSPRLLSPIVLSPTLFSPIVLSPLLLDPVILSPGIATPFILSPLLLTPIILSPLVLCPLILSPVALSPLILSPTLLSPLILSPFVLTPSVLSPPTLGALILSPYALSPSIESTPHQFTVFASPSFLS